MIKMKKATKFTLITMIVATGLCVPYIVIVHIIRTGDYWSLLYLLWGLVIIWVATTLLATQKDVPDDPI